jgi:hypothetical protein
MGNADLYDVTEDDVEASRQALETSRPKRSKDTDADAEKAPAKRGRKSAAPEQ